MSTETAVIAPDAEPIADTTPWYSTAYDPATPGKLSDDWLSKAPDDIRKDLEPYAKEKDPFEIAFKAVGRVKETQRALHEKRSADAGLPPKPEGEAATPEALAAYYKARNLPADPKEYGLTRPAELPEGLWNQEFADKAAKLFHDLELSPETVKQITAFQQQNAMALHAQHQAAMAAQQQAEKDARTAYIQSEKEALVKMFGQRVDPALKAIAKIGEVTGYDKEFLNPDNPERYVGKDTVKFMESLVAMIPKAGDSTRRELGGSPNGGGLKDVNYFKSLKKGDPDYEALQSSAHPRNKEVYDARVMAYDMEAAARGE